MHIYAAIKTMVTKSIIIRENKCSPFITTGRELKTTSDKDLEQGEQASK